MVLSFTPVGGKDTTAIGYQEFLGIATGKPITRRRADCCKTARGTPSDHRKQLPDGPMGAESYELANPDGLGLELSSRGKFATSMHIQQLQARGQGIPGYPGTQKAWFEGRYP
eukprot:2621996-Rhodomonas_salina.1